jgi:hypothetical protein
MSRHKSKQRKPRKPPCEKAKAKATTLLSWRDRLNIALWIIVPLLLTGVLVIAAAKSWWERSIDDRLAKWQQAYQLSDKTVEQFRRIEIDFHGSGNPFNSPIRRSPQEVHIHHQQMAEIIGEPKGKLFLKDISSGRWKH